MGFLSDLVSGRSGGSAAHGGHGIDPSSILSQTNSNALSPTNPGNLQNVRTHQVVNSPVVFNREQADQICVHEAMSAHLMQHTKRAFKALGRQEGHDAELQATYRNYQTRVAAGEMKKVRSNASYAKALHGMRGAYATLGYGLETAAVNANQRVIEIKARLAGIR